MDSTSRGKRPRLEEDDEESTRQPTERKVRFPKGKKSKGKDLNGGFATAEEDDDEGKFGSWMNAQLASKERARRRYDNREAEVLGSTAAIEISSAEVQYEDDANLEDDGIRIEPFNLEQEREEGYFDESGNYVEYATQNEIKDAWLDNVEVDPKLAEKVKAKDAEEEEYQELSPEEIAKLKRNIANVLHPGETIMQALRRLKVSSSDGRGKMPEGTKRIFDQLTEDAMKLMENGDYNVYHEERETFDREAEGYERLARAREGIFGTGDNGESYSLEGKHINSDGAGQALNAGPVALEANNTRLQASADGGDGFDMFGDDDEVPNQNPQSNGAKSTSEQMLQAADGRVGSDYVYDESSGYYYSSSLGYYYDPTSGLYCCASTGKWYSFNEQIRTYVEIQNTETEGTQAV